MFTNKPTNLRTLSFAIVMAAVLMVGTGAPQMAQAQTYSSVAEQRAALLAQIQQLMVILERLQWEKSKNKSQAGNERTVVAPTTGYADVDGHPSVNVEWFNTGLQSDESYSMRASLQSEDTKEKILMNRFSQVAINGEQKMSVRLSSISSDELDGEYRVILSLLRTNPETGAGDLIRSAYSNWFEIDEVGYDNSIRAEDAKRKLDQEKLQFSRELERHKEFSGSSDRLANALALLEGSSINLTKAELAYEQGDYDAVLEYASAASDTTARAQNEHNQIDWGFDKEFECLESNTCTSEDSKKMLQAITPTLEVSKGTANTHFGGKRGYFKILFTVTAPDATDVYIPTYLGLYFQYTDDNDRTLRDGPSTKDTILELSGAELVEVNGNSYYKIKKEKTAKFEAHSDFKPTRSGDYYASLTGVQFLRNPSTNMVSLISPEFIKPTDTITLKL